MTKVITDEHGKQWYPCSGKDCAGRHKQVICTCTADGGCKCHSCETLVCSMCSLAQQRAERAAKE